MFRKTIISMTLLTASLLCSATDKDMSTEKQLTLAADSKTDYRIVIAESCSVQEKFAAAQLREYLKKITGADFPTLKEKQTLAAGKYIFVGNTTTARGTGYAPAIFDKEEWLIKTLPDGNIIIAGGQPRGTLYGVYEFLEKFGDVVWTDEYSEYVPVKSKFSISPISIRKKPEFWLRAVICSPPVDMEKFRMFFHHNKSNYGYNSEEMGGNEAYGSPGMVHTFYEYSKNWTEDKIDCFSLNDDGKRLRARDGGGPGQICLMNKEARNLFYKRLIEYIKADRAGCAKDGPFPKLYVIDMNDNMNFCKCPECKALAEKEGSFSGPMLDFINDLADRVKKDYPDIYLSCIAYTKLAIKPPKTIEPRDNVLIRICDLGSESGMADSESLKKVTDPQNAEFKEIVESWSKISKHIGIWEYWVLYGKPFAFPYSVIGNLENDFRFYKKNNVKIMVIESEYADQTSFFELKRWLALKLTQSPEEPVNQLVDKFMNAYYSKAAGIMKEYLDYLEKRQNEDPDIRYGKTLPYQYKYLDYEFFMTVNTLLDNAEKLVTDDKDASIHVRHERVPVDSAMLYLWKNLDRDSGKKLPFSKVMVLSRYKANRLEQIARYTNPSRYNEFSTTAAEFNNQITALELELPPPDHIKNPLQLIDIFWAEMKPLPHLGSILAEDKDACGGKALKLINNKKLENFFVNPLNVYVYNTNLKKVILQRSIPQSEIIADGKYHWYDIGKAAITPGALLVLHKTWHLQTVLDKAVSSEPEWEVHISLKFTGPTYVPGSKEEDAIWLDRIVLTK